MSVDGLDPRARDRRIRDTMLLGSASILALLAGGTTANAANINGRIGTVAPTTAYTAAAAAAAQQAASAAAQAQSSLTRAAAAIAAARRSEQAAAASAASSLPNGLTAGGLVASDPSYSSYWWVGANAPVQTQNGSQVTVDIKQTQPKAILYWNSFNIGANTTVKYEQQSSNWIALNRVNNSSSPSQIFGKITAPGGVYLINSNGIVFGAGSQLNVNTLIASSLDVGALGGALSTRTSQGNRDADFLNLGVATPPSFSFFDWTNPTSLTTNPPKDGSGQYLGNIVVQRGASITAAPGPDQGSTGGNIYLFGTNIQNSGWLSAPLGEIAMVAARTIDLVPNGYSQFPTNVVAADPKTKYQQFRGTEFRLSQFADKYSSSGLPATGSSTFTRGTGAVVHDGLIEATRGTLIMDGDTVTIGNPMDASGKPLLDPAIGTLVQGVISADSSIANNSFVMLRAATAVIMNGVISSLPYDDGSSLPSGGSSGSTIASFTPPYVEMTAQSTVTMGSGSLISAPSATVQLRVLDFQNDKSVIYQKQFDNGVERKDGDTTVYLDGLFSQGGNTQGVSSTTGSVAQSVVLSPGSVIDLAGLQSVSLPAGYNFISFQARSEFANMPVQRSGPLYGQTLWVDIRASGTRSDGTSWVGTPLGDVSTSVGRSIYQLMTVGGSLTLQTDITSNNGGGQVLTAGSVINVAGGSQQFQSGWVPGTVLLGADGRRYSMANADPNRVYVGIANQFTVDHSHWGFKETWSTLAYSPGYKQGQDAGSVKVTTVWSDLSAGTIFFGSLAGPLQLAQGSLPAQGSLTVTIPSSIEIGSSPSSDYSITPDPKLKHKTVTLNADALSGYGLSSLSITANDVVVSRESTLNLAPLGTFTVLAGGAIDIAGTVSMAGGLVSLTTDRYKLLNGGPLGLLFSLNTLPTIGNDKIAANVYVEGVIDVGGRFVNDTGRAPSDITGPAAINGGSIAIATNSVSNQGKDDWTGSIILAKGSLLDVSSGGYVSPLGKPKTTAAGVMAGKGGSISLSLYQGASFAAYNPGDPNSVSALTSPQFGPAAIIALDGDLRGYGFQSNGSLTLSGVDNLQIGGSLPKGRASNVLIADSAVPLPESFFTGGGFGSYTIQSVRDGHGLVSGGTTPPPPATITVAAGVNLTLAQQNLASTADYSQTATGTKLGQQDLPALARLPDDERQPVNLTLNADSIVLEAGSTIHTDPLAKITIGNVNNLAGGAPGTPQAASNVKLGGTIIDHGGSLFINALSTQLGSKASIDLSGTFIASSTFGLLQGGSPTSGSYLPGGSFTVEGGVYTTVTNTTLTNGLNYYAAPGSSSSLVTANGAQIDVSGAAGPLAVAGPRGATSSVWAWSDAGIVTADVAQSVWGGDFAAAGGRYIGGDGQTHVDPRANNGTIILGGGPIALIQGVAELSHNLAVLTNYQNGTGPGTNAIYVAADQLAPFDNVYLYSGGVDGGAKRIFTDLNGANYGYDAPPSFADFRVVGSVNLNVANRLHIAANSFYVDPKDVLSVQLSAPYVELTGGRYVNSNSSNTSDYLKATSGNSNFGISGQMIDVEGVRFQNFSQVKLVSSGDIRLGTLKVTNGSTKTTDAQVFTGSLTSDGDVLLSAERIYPISAVASFVPTASNTSQTLDATSTQQLTFATANSLGLAPGIPVLVRSTSDPNGTYVLGTVITDNATQLVVAGLAFKGSGTHSDWQISPVSAGFTIQSPGSVQFSAPAGANAATPLSAGGGLTVIARRIDQGGNIFAPLGQVKLGNTDSTVSSITTQSVTLEPGSLTSVTLAGTTVPYGAIGDSGSWYYNASLNSLASSPSKGVVLAGANVNVGQGSTIDLRGGGDLQAAQWISGIGGTVDTLQTTASAPTVYALVPSVNAPIAAYDIHFATSRSLDGGQTAIAGDANPLVGTQITMAGGGGVAGGTYTLYPAHYATLPGAMRVTVYKPSNLGLNIPSGAALTDGTVLVTGNFNQSTAPGKQSAGSTVFAVRNNAVWRSYSEYQFTSANSYFRTLAAKNGSIIPLPFDAGSLQVLVDAGSLNGVTPSLKLGGTFLSQPGRDASGNRGSGGTLDIASPQNIDIVGDAQYTSGAVAAGDVAIDVSELGSSGFESILIGGVRTISGAVTLITPGSAGILVDTQGQAFSAPEILMVAASKTTTDGSGNASAVGGNVTIASGSVIETTGVLHQAPGRFYRFASQNTTGALFAATNDTSLNAAGPTGSSAAPGTGVIRINEGARVTTGVLTLQASNARQGAQAIVIDPASLHVGQLNLLAQTVGLGAQRGASSESLDLYNYEFGSVGGLSIKALNGAIDIYGDFNPGSSVTALTLDTAALSNASSGSANISVDSGGTITLLNSGAAPKASAPLAATGTALGMTATQIVLGGAGLTNTQSILGYGSFNLSTAERVVIAGPGGLMLGSQKTNSDGSASFVDNVDLTIKSPLVMVAGASGAGGGAFAITTGGNVAILDTVAQVGFGARPTDSPDIGGSLSVKAKGIQVGTAIQAQAGTINLEATAGDVTLLPRATLYAAGYAQTLRDITSYISGGRVALTSGEGNVYLSAGSVIDVAQPQDRSGSFGPGYGGEIDLIARSGNATIAGFLLGGGGAGHGGTFKLDVMGGVDLGHYVDAGGNVLYGLVPGLAESYQGGLSDILLFGGFTGGIDIHTKTGNIVLAQGRTLKANSITLTADDPTWDAKSEWSPTNSGQLGQVLIYGTLDASGSSGATGDGVGEAGGQVALYGANAVLLASTAVVDASTTHGDQLGGNVIVGIGWSDPTIINSNIYLQQGATINVSGGTKGGLSGGTVTFVAPRDGHNDMKLVGLYQGRLDPITNVQGKPALADKYLPAVDIIGARAVTFDPYVSFDTTAATDKNGKVSSKQYGIDASGLGWAGIIDAAGLYDATGHFVTDGTWLNVNGWVLTVPANSAFSEFSSNSAGGQLRTSISEGTGTLVISYGVLSFTPDASTAINAAGAPASLPSPSPGKSIQFSVTFKSPGGQDATGSATWDGTSLSITIANPGSGFTRPPTSAMLSYNNQTWTVAAAMVKICTGLGCRTVLQPIHNSFLKIVSATLDSSGYSDPNTQPQTILLGNLNSYSTFTKTTKFGGLDVPADPSAATSEKISIAPSKGRGSGTVKVTTDASGNSQNVFDSLNVLVLPFADSNVLANDPSKPGSASFTGATLQPDGTLVFKKGTSGDFFQNVLQQVTGGAVGSQAAWKNGDYSYGFDNLFDRLNTGNGGGPSLVAQLGAGVMHVQPGVQLVNSSTGVNKGNITVADNWNLASGALYDKTTNQIASTYDPAKASNYYVAFKYRLATSWGSVDAGSLSLRANGTIDIGSAASSATISDGFFQFANYLDPDYIAGLVSAGNSVLSSDRSVSNKYTLYLNGVSAPLAPYNNGANGISPSAQDLATMDLFPYTLNVCISNCGTPSAQLVPVTAPSSWSYSFTAGAVLGSANPLARTSNGDVNLNNHSSYAQPVLVQPTSGTVWAQANSMVNLPTVIRTGTGSVTVAAAGSVVMRDTTAPGVIYAAGVNAPMLPNAYGGSAVVSNPDGFFEPRVLAYNSGGVSNGTSYYGPPTAAAFSVMGGNVVINAQLDVLGYNGSRDPNYVKQNGHSEVPQYFMPWLLADAALTPSQTLSAISGAGVFAPAGSLIASQTAWWIQYSSFEQGFLSGGGNVTVQAGRDLVDVSVSLPTTGRVSGGLSSASTPVTHLYGSGNMLVRAGRNIQGGAFYEGSGDASIVARGSIGQVVGSDGALATVALHPNASSSEQLPDLPLLAVDTGHIDVSARGSMSIAGVVNPASLQAQANPLLPAGSLHLDTYGPDSGVHLVSVRGDLTIAVAPTAYRDTYLIGSNQYSIDAAPAVYPASLQALALNGSLITTGIQFASIAKGNPIVEIKTPGIVLSPSDHGRFELLARDSVDLTFGFPVNTPLLSYSPRPYFSAGPALLQTGFDPYRPNSGFDGATPGSQLAHTDDTAAGIDATARIYAVNGSIIATGTYGPSVVDGPSNGYQIMQVNRPAEIYAGTDITDLSVIIQNIRPGDVSTITAGRNIVYSGYNNGGGMQVAGPGALFVQAGGDIGPFLPAFVDNTTSAQVQEGIASVGNGSATPVGDLHSSQYAAPYSIGIYDQSLYGNINNPRRNTLLTAAAGTSQGADLFVTFGVRSQPDYQAMIDRYINPAAPGSYQGYTLAINGVPVDPQSGWAAFQKASAAEQRKVIYEVFFDVIRNVAKQGPTATTCPQVCLPAWAVINTLFPTGHSIGSGGELNLLHGTIQTRLGGSISILGPGGNIVVGSLATEPNKDLGLRDLGILSLGGGGINTYTDGNVFVNASRILTTQGGDVLMWSSHGDLDAGRGSKTIVSAPSIQVYLDENDYGTTDPGGYVTGSGIGTLQASANTPPGDLYLVAPNGTIDFGTAGVRASGKLVVVAPVLANQSNATFTTSNIVPTVNVAGLTSGSNTAGAAAKSAEPATASGPSQRDQASVFIVEVVGYGGGESPAQPASQQNDDQKPRSENGSGGTLRTQTP